jgi:lysophospholipase L1-like esterase
MGGLMDIKWKRYSLCLAFVTLILTTTLAIYSTVKFRNKLHGYIDNKEWQTQLSEQGLYDDTKIVFFGDSQIALWWMAPSFGSLPIINKGISGDWASLAVGRFDKDVLAVNPTLVVILIGTNDLGNNQPVDTVIKNIEVMVKAASERGIKVIVCSLLPVSGEQIAVHSPQKILEVNNGLKNIATLYKADYVDLHSKLKDGVGNFKEDLTRDGLHPSAKGYLVMSKTLFPHLINDLSTVVKI